MGRDGGCRGSLAERPVVLAIAPGLLNYYLEDSELPEM